MLQDLSIQFDRFAVHAQLYPSKSHPRFHGSLVRAYSTFLDVSLEAKKLFGDKSAKKGLTGGFAQKSSRKLLKQGFLDAKTKLEHLVNEVTQEYDIAEKIESSVFRTEVRTKIKRDMNRELFKWLDEVDVKTRLDYLASVHEPGTGSWLVQEDFFRSWTQKTNAALWLHAKPGAGKSVMAYTVIQHLRQTHHTTNSTIMYYFCDYKNIKSQSARKVFQTILANLCQQCLEAQEIVESLFQRYRGRNLVCPVGTLRDTLRSCLLRLPKSFIVIDALDECSEPEELLEKLQPLLDGQLGLNLFLTSRKLDNISSYMNHPRIQQCSLAAESHSKDISCYVKAQLDNRLRKNKEKLWDQKLRVQIEEELCSKADGMFQWVNCQIDALSKCISDKQILAKLKTLPASLDETYVRALEGLCREFPDERPSLRCFFFWLVHALRPLKISELSCTMAFDAETKRHDFHAVPADPGDVLQYSAGLFGLTDTDGTVGLCHYSVKEFLTSEKIKATSVSDFFAGDAKSQLQVLDTCFSLLCEEELSTGQCWTIKALRLRKEDYPLLEYAAYHWLGHYKLVEENINSDLEQRILAFFTE
ncbi:uncharacterized protein K452DRAFT_250225, partial [Aplosporella prunicola CBS 121167]